MKSSLHTDELMGAVVAPRGDLDGLVFTAGICKHDPATRTEIMAGLTRLGLSLDTVANATGTCRISAKDSRVEAWVIPTSEELTIARHTAAVFGTRLGMR